MTWKKFLDKYFWSSKGQAITHGLPSETTQKVVIHYDPNHPSEFPRDMRTGVKMTPEAIHEERMTLKEAQDIIRRHRKRADVIELRR